MQTPQKSFPDMPPLYTLAQKVLGYSGLALFLLGIAGFVSGYLINDLPLGGIGLLIVAGGMTCIAIYGFTLGKRYIVTGIAALCFALAVALFALSMLHGGGQYGSPPEP